MVDFAKNMLLLYKRKLGEQLEGQNRLKVRNTLSSSYYKLVSTTSGGGGRGREYHHFRSDSGIARPSLFGKVIKPVFLLANLYGCQIVSEDNI